jgi:hypothetical protein
MTDEQIATKFHENAGGLLSSEAADRLVHTLLTDERGATAREIARCVQA